VREVNPFVRAEYTADDDSTFDFMFIDLGRFEFDLAIAQENGIAVFNRARETGEVHGYR
jgi:hypothetical protein